MDIVAHRRANSGHVFVIQGDLTAQPVEAIVNAANANLAHGGGVAAAIVRVGGRVIQEESDTWVRENGPVEPGQAAVTTGGSLHAAHVIHVVGPRFRAGQDNAGMLRAATVAALEAAARIGARSVAFPAISAGIFGYPADEATAVMAGAVLEWMHDRPGRVEEVRLVAIEPATARSFAAALGTDEPAAGQDG